MTRVEDKYVLSYNDMVKLEKRVQGILEYDRNGTDEGYRISSVYFDDAYDSMLTDSVNGNPVREKYRIRIYNDSLSLIKLEIKKKKYNRIIKLSSTIDQEEYARLIRGETIADNGSLDDARTIFNLAMKMRGLSPKIIVAYERKAFLFEPGNVRITFDRNIRASRRIDLFGDPSTVYDYPDGFGSVLEVKYDECIPRFIKQLLEHEKMIRTANSKYAACREIYKWRM